MFQQKKILFFSFFIDLLIMIRTFVKNKKYEPDNFQRNKNFKNGKFYRTFKEWKSRPSFLKLNVEQEGIEII